MNARELLESAAKAAGLVGYIYEWIQGPTFIVPADPADPRSDAVTYDWFDDDGDALRLAVKLGITLSFVLDDGGPPFTNAQRVCSDVLAADCFEFHGDPCAATRRAIVRAAAAIGKGKQ